MAEETYFEERDGIRLLRFEAYRNETGISCGVTTRYRIASDGRKTSYDVALSAYHNREEREYILAPLKSALGVREAAYMRQYHTANIAVVQDGVEINNNTDGMITNVPGLGLFAVAADCGMTCFYDRRNHAIGVMHSGWRGALQNIYSTALNAMRLNYGTRPEDIVSCSAPMICAAHYQVQKDFVEKLKLFYPDNYQKFLLEKGGNTFFDLRCLLRFQLEQLGICNYHFATQCTYENPDLFPSYRRDGIPGQSVQGHFGMMAAIRGNWQLSVSS